MQAPQSSPEPSDAQTHVCALWMHDGSSLRPGLMAEPWYTQQGQGLSSQKQEKQNLSSGEALDTQLTLCKYDQGTINMSQSLGMSTHGSA